MTPIASCGEAFSMFLCGVVLLVVLLSWLLALSSWACLFLLTFVIMAVALVVVAVVVIVVVCFCCCGCRSRRRGRRRRRQHCYCRGRRPYLCLLMLRLFVNAAKTAVKHMGSGCMIFAEKPNLFRFGWVI